MSTLNKIIPVLCMFCMLMRQIIPLTFTLVCTWYEESTPRVWKEKEVEHVTCVLFYNFLFFKGYLIQISNPYVTHV